MSGKPVIHAVTAGNNLVRDANCGISVPAEDAGAVFEAINKMLALTQEERQKLGNNGREYVIKNHDYKFLAKKIIEFIK